MEFVVCERFNLITHSSVLSYTISAYSLPVILHFAVGASKGFAIWRKEKVQRGQLGYFLLDKY